MISVLLFLRTGGVWQKMSDGQDFYSERSLKRKITTDQDKTKIILKQL